ncbi:MAG: hypothetical protein R3D85_02585 [Paracoccaceae bacterium]
MDLSGDWTGVYDYGGDGPDAVPFTATLIDVGGVIWGDTQEPNSFAPSAGPELIAEISGTRSGAELRFRKAYLGNPEGGDDPIHYAGHVSAGGKRIEGRWRINAPGGAIGGPFVMTRIGGVAVSRGLSRKAAVTVS